jgi:DNA-binding transcriptional MerR regulator
VDKAPEAFRTISEVAEELDVPHHVLRFWESRFQQIRPMKRGGGRRYYRPDDVDLLRGIRFLLYGEGYTIRGVQRILREQGGKFVQTVWQPGAPQPTGDLALSAEQGSGELEEAVAEEEPFGHPLHDERREPALLKPAPPVAGKGNAKPAAAAIGGVKAGLAPDELQKLKAALNELGECRRLIDAVMKDAS